MDSAVSITDRMKYGVTPIAVRSMNNLHNIKASKDSSFEVNMGQHITVTFPPLTSELK